MKNIYKTNIKNRFKNIALKFPLCYDLHEL